MAGREWVLLQGQGHLGETLLNLAKRESEAISLHFWEQGDDTEHAFFTDAQNNHVPRPHREQLRDLTRHVIAPDAFFCLTVPGKSPGEQAALYFFLEADRSTMSHARLLTKFKAYWRLNRANLEGPRRSPALVTIR